MPGYDVMSLLQVVVQQDVTLAAVQAQAAEKLAAVTDELAAVRAKHVHAGKLAAAKVETERMRLTEKNEAKERAASKKATGTKEQDELEKQIMKEDRKRDAPFKAKKLKREEDQDKDWNPKGRR